MATPGAPDLFSFLETLAPDEKDLLYRNEWAVLAVLHSLSPLAKLCVMGDSRSKGWLFTPVSPSRDSQNGRAADGGEEGRADRHFRDAVVQS